MSLERRGLSQNRIVARCGGDESSKYNRVVKSAFFDAYLLSTLFYK
jgi:hypothetical protein